MTADNLFCDSFQSLGMREFESFLNGADFRPVCDYANERLAFVQPFEYDGSKYAIVAKGKPMSDYVELSCFPFFEDEIRRDLFDEGAVEGEELNPELVKLIAILNCAAAYGCFFGKFSTDPKHVWRYDFELKLNGSPSVNLIRWAIWQTIVALVFNKTELDAVAFYGAATDVVEQRDYENNSEEELILLGNAAVKLGDGELFYELLEHEANIFGIELKDVETEFGSYLRNDEFESSFRRETRDYEEFEVPEDESDVSESPLSGETRDYEEFEIPEDESDAPVPPNLVARILGDILVFMESKESVLSSDEFASRFEDDSVFDSDGYDGFLAEGDGESSGYDGFLAEGDGDEDGYDGFLYPSDDEDDDDDEVCFIVEDEEEDDEICFVIDADEDDDDEKREEETGDILVLDGDDEDGETFRIDDGVEKEDDWDEIFGEEDVLALDDYHPDEDYVDEEDVSKEKKDICDIFADKGNDGDGETFFIKIDIAKKDEEKTTSKFAKELAEFLKKHFSFLSYWSKYGRDERFPWDGEREGGASDGVEEVDGNEEGRREEGNERCVGNERANEEIDGRKGDENETEEDE